MTELTPAERSRVRRAWLARWHSAVPHPHALARVARMVEDHFITVEFRRRGAVNCVEGDAWLADESELYRSALRPLLNTTERVGWRAMLMVTHSIEWIAAHEINVWPAPVVTAEAA